MSVNTIPRPDVKVIQEFATVSPTSAVPTLPACIMGAGFQIVEAVDDTGALNPEALTTTPAKIIFPYVAATYAGLGAGLDLVFSVDNAAAVTVTFNTGVGGAAITPAEAKADIDALAIAGIVTTIEVSGATSRLVISTIAEGQFASLEITGGTSVPVPLNTLAIDQKTTGRDAYNNYFLFLASIGDYPDPRSNIDELDIDFDSVRVFFDLGGGNFNEVSRTGTFLQGATSAVAVVDDGDGDNLSPFLSFVGADFTAAISIATGDGTTDLTAITYGVAGDFDPPLNLILSVDGGDFQTIVFDTGIVDATALLAAINAPFVGTVATLGGGNVLTLTSLASFGGEESVLRIDPNSSALTILGLAAGSPFAAVDSIYGDPYQPIVGDSVIVDGITIGSITEVASGGNVNRLRLDLEALLSFTGAQWVLQAQGLDNNAASALRPSSDLQVDPDNGSLVIKHEQIRDAAGLSTAANQLVYVGYNALRLDVSPAGAGFNLLRFGDLTTLQNDLSPIDTQNPLGLGLFFALLNAPGLEVTGLGVSDASDTEPDGTLVAYTEAFEFLESKDVYAISPMTHDLNVGRVAELHVDEMSDPENAGERVVFLNPNVPTRNANAIVASGATANTPGGGSTLDTGVANLPALVAAAGLGAGPYTIADNLFVEMESDTNKYLILSISGSVVTVSTGVLAGNSDAFYSQVGPPAFAAAIVDRPFSVAVRGAVLANLTEEAIAYAALAQGFANRRVIVTTPDTAIATIDGLSQQVAGYYIGAALCGLTSSKQPQDPLTNVDLTGFDGLVGATDRYGEAQLKIMDGGGLWSLFQPSDGRPIQTRHQLATDMSTIEKREFSITTAVDFASKFLRTGLRNFIGRFNITGQVNDSISITLDGLGAFLVSQGVFSSFTVARIAQSSLQPDKLELDVAVGVLYPLNEIQLRLVI